MYGSHVNKLNVYLKYGSNLGTPIFFKQGSQGQQWKQGQITIQPTAPFNVCTSFLMIDNNVLYI